VMILSVVESKGATLAKGRIRNAPPAQNEYAEFPASPSYASVASLSASRRISVSGIANSVKPQSKQTKSCGETNTKGLPRPLRPGK